MEYNIPISQDKYNKAALKVINCFLDLTDLEMNLISTMMNNHITILDTQARIDLRTELNRSEAQFNNYIKRLKDKKVLITQEEGLVLNSNILNTLLDKEIIIRFNVN